MTERGNQNENAVAERDNNNIKNGLLKGMKFYTIEEVRTALKRVVDFYNNERPHWRMDRHDTCAGRKDAGRNKKEMEQF